MFLNLWNIGSRARVCVVTGQPFAPGGSFYTALFMEEGSGNIIRQDFSPEAWEGRSEYEAKPFSVWKSVCPASGPGSAAGDTNAREGALPKATAESLLRQLMEEGRPGQENACYILALMLERKKVLRQVSAREMEDGRVLVYEHGKTGEVFVVKDPGLHLAEMAHVQEEVAAWLKAPEQLTRRREGAKTEKEEEEGKKK